MIHLSRKSLLALEAVLDVALNARPDPVQARDITKRQGIPQRYLEQVMQALVRSNILRGVRGPRGGYRLARERRRISVKEIFAVIEALEKDADHVASQSPLNRDIVEPFHQHLQQALHAAMGETTIADLCAQMREPSSTTNRNESDFTI